MQRRNLLKLLMLETVALNFIYTGKLQAGTWSYQGETGTDFWGKLAPEFQLCRLGKAQSPINIESSVVTTDIGNLQLNYQATPLTIVNDGRTIKVTYQPGSSLTLDDQVYELLQFHFHQPSEHLILGKAAEMEAHFVHKNEATGDLVVLAVLMSQGEFNLALDSIWQKTLAGHRAKISDLTINALQLLPESRQYYRYQGSLTTPPCSEIVTWLVLKQPVSISQSQLTSFREIMGNNARPIQALNQRFLQEFN